MPKKNQDIRFVMKEATSDEGMTKHDYLAFHGFNPNGVVKQKMNFDDVINYLIDVHGLRSGFYHAYGGGDDYYRKQIIDASMKTNRTKTHTAFYLVRSAYERIESAKRAIAEFYGRSVDDIMSENADDYRAYRERKDAEHAIWKAEWEAERAAKKAAEAE